MRYKSELKMQNAKPPKASGLGTLSFLRACLQGRRALNLILPGKVLLCLLFLVQFLTACTTDCVYRSYTTSDGQSACARICPLKDEDGNEVVDSNGKTVFEEPEAGEDVHQINCDPFRNVTASGTTATTSTTSG